MGENKPRIHPAVLHAQEQLRQGAVSRREFMRLATLLGVTVSSASFMAACAQQDTSTPEPAEEVQDTSGIKRGGILRWSSLITPVDHPARLSWGAPAHIIGAVAERLTTIDSDGITHPMLLERWEANDDVTEWTLYLNKGIKFHHGPEFVADDVLFNIEQWLDEEVGSSILGLMSGYISANDVEVVDDYTVKLHCTAPEIAVPEHLLHYPALIMPRDWEGDWLRQPYGTGPFELEEWTVEERVVLKAAENYWQMGEDGNPLPYLDGAEVFDFGDERSPVIAAMQSGEFHTIAETAVEDVLALEGEPDLVVERVAVAQTACMRMRSDVEPWNDNRLRKALRLCQQRQAILDTSIFGEGAIGADTHTMKIHPAYCEVDVPAYDPEQAKALLAEAGYEDGMDVTISVSSGFPATVSYAETVKEGAEPAGFRVNVETLPGSEYWNVWTEVPVGITEWGHRPLGTMVFNLAYTSDADGNPVPWNESKWVDEEFDEVLAQANGTLDIEERREHMCTLEAIQQERGSVGMAWFRNVWRIKNKSVQNMPVHPMQYDIIHDVWLDEEE